MLGGGRGKRKILDGFRDRKDGRQIVFRVNMFEGTAERAEASRMVEMRAAFHSPNASYFKPKN